MKVNGKWCWFYMGEQNYRLCSGQLIEFEGRQFTSGLAVNNDVFRIYFIVNHH